jgi:LysR family glycine cleavage system transcriptional activator
MAHLPSLQTLRAFEAAVRHQSYSRAADELGLTHGAISHRIRELEARTGEVLFERSGNNMLPTNAARRMLPALRQAFGLLESLFPPAGPQERLTLKIGVLPSFAAYWLIPRLKRFREVQPDVAIILDARLELVPVGRGGGGGGGGGGVDAAIRFGQGEWPGVMAERLVGEVLYPVCAPDYRRRLDIREPADLERCQLLRHSWVPWSLWLRAAGLGWGEPLQAPAWDDAGHVLDAAVAGDGVALARSVLVEDAIAAGRLVRLFDIEVPAPGAYYYLRSPQHSRLDSGIEAFGRWLKNTLEYKTPPG